MNKHIKGVPNYILLDGARVDGALAEIRSNNSENECLYKGKSEQVLAGLAPYLFTYHAGTHIANEYVQTGWGDSWGVLLDTSYPIEAMVLHFRKFLIVQTEDLKELYFRFYDPRVLRLFLPTCDGKQLKEFFGPINHFYCEDEDPEFALIFSLEESKLITKRIKTATLFPEMIETAIQEPDPADASKQDHAHKTPHYLHSHETKKRTPRKYFD